MVMVVVSTPFFFSDSEMVLHRASAAPRRLILAELKQKGLVGRIMLVNGVFSCDGCGRPQQMRTASRDQECWIRKVAYTGEGGGREQAVAKVCSQNSVA